MILKTSSTDFLNGLVFGFDVGTGSIGYAVRQGNKFLHKATLLIPAEFEENKTGEDCPRRLCLRNTFEQVYPHGG
jgi:hypothetical protein